MVYPFLRVKPRTFNIVCSILGLTFLLLSQGVKWVQYDRQHLPQTQDFDQYYMGGVIARHGAWADLYPMPRAGMNPGEPENSTLRPRYLELAKQYGFDEQGGGTRYMQPPPFALLFVPLTFLPLRLAHALWIVMLCFATWGIARQSARAYQLCSGRNDHIIGLIILLICFSLQAHRWTRVGNMSAIIGWLIGFIGLSLAMDRHGVRPAIAVVIAGLAKYVSVILLPIHVAARHFIAANPFELLGVEWRPRHRVASLTKLVDQGRRPKPILDDRARSADQLDQCVHRFNAIGVKRRQRDHQDVRGHTLELPRCRCGIGAGRDDVDIPGGLTVGRSDLLLERFADQRHADVLG